MNRQSNTIEDSTQTKDFFMPSAAQIKKLRCIIRAETGFKFTYSDAEEVSYQLISLYECLARGRPIVTKEKDSEA
jgi:hypothetical protein